MVIEASVLANALADESEARERARIRSSRCTPSISSACSA